LLILLEQVIDKQALKHTDRDLTKMKDKTMSIVTRIGIKSFLNIEKGSVYASYKYLLHPLNRLIILKLKTITNPETFNCIFPSWYY
jgi:hypothetical protein